MKSFLSTIDGLEGIDSAAVSNLKGLIKTKMLEKGEVLQRQGEKNGFVYFVKQGMLRSYTIDKKGKEHIFMFAPENWLMADGSHFDAPNSLYIDVLENTEVEVISQKAFEQSFVPLTNKSDENTTSSMAKRIAVLQKRVILLMSASAIERYEHFTETYPNVLQRVPQKMIASYLGLTPETLSKVKGEKARSHHI